jgi:hypothetical protein
MFIIYVLHHLRLPFPNASHRHTTPVHRRRQLLLIMHEQRMHHMPAQLLRLSISMPQMLLYLPHLLLIHGLHILL